MNAYQQAKAAQIVEILDTDDELWDFVADAIAMSRDKGARSVDDRDSGDVLEDVLAALRAAT